MTAIAQAGILAFGPEPVLDTMAHESVDTLFGDSILSSYAASGTPESLMAYEDLRDLPVPGQITIEVLTGSNLTGDFTVHGVKFGETAEGTEVVAFGGDKGPHSTTAVFTSVTQIDVPSAGSRTIKIGHRMAPIIFRHRAADIDLSAIDDVRLGPPEIGGIPTPTFPYKGGQLVTGGATLYPRLENSFLYLLWAAIGYHTGYTEEGGAGTYLYEEGTVNAEYIDDVHAAITLGAAPQNITTNIVNPSDPSKIAVLREYAGTTEWTGDVVITGTDENGDPATETLTFTSGSGLEEDVLETAGLFETVTQIDVPTRTSVGTDIAKVGFLMYDHALTFNPGEGLSACIPWMTFYKFIPSGTCEAADTDSLWEMYEDCKLVGVLFTLPNDAPIAARFDVLGRKWHFSESNPATYMAGYEDYQSIPVGCHTGGWIKIPTYSESELPIVSAQMAIANTPLDIRQEKRYGTPELDDVTIVSRAFTIDMIVRWADADLYRRVYTGDVAGTEWTEKPFVESLDVEAVSNGHPDDCAAPWKLRVECPSVMFAINGGVRLAGNQAVMLRVTGTALAPTTGEYITVTLTNRDRLYRWPVS
jgi:hypothetical protein